MYYTQYKITSAYKNEYNYCSLLFKMSDAKTWIFILSDFLNFQLSILFKFAQKNNIWIVLQHYLIAHFQSKK